MTKTLVILLLCFGITADTAYAQRDILFAELYLPWEIDRWYNGVEYPRLEKLCWADRACGERSFERKIWPLNAVYSAPNTRSPVLGRLEAVSDFKRDRHLYFRIDYHPLAGPPQVWISDAGDWGYGMDLFVLARRGSWVQLPSGPFPKPVWIRLRDYDETTSGTLMGGAGSIVGTVISVADGIPAIDRRTGRRTRLPGATNYVIERITGDQVYLRREVGADMPCGEPDAEKDVPTGSTTRFRVRMTALFRNGAPMLEPAYGRGC